MKTSNDNLERVARHLDGEAAELTEADKALAAEIADDGRRVGAALEMSVPPGVLHRVAGRMAAASPARVAASIRRRRWVIRVLAGVSAAAAAVIIAVSMSGPPPVLTEAPPSAGDLVAEFVKTRETPVDASLALLREEMADVAADLAEPDPWSTEGAMADLEAQIGAGGVGSPTSVWPEEWDELKDAF